MKIRHQSSAKYFVNIAVATLLFFSCISAYASLREAMKEYGLNHYKAAIKQLQPLADKGDVIAQHTLGIMNENGQGMPKNQSKAASWYSKAAEQGYADAQLKLGLMYEAGSGLARNDSKAAFWYRRAAVQGNPAAQNNLGMMYLKGKGISQDFNMAAKWFEKAALRGDFNAQLSLGTMYATGQGIPIDLIQADKWFAAAALKGNAHGKQNQLLVEGNMNKEQIDDAQTLALEWFLGHKIPRIQSDPEQTPEHTVGNAP
jgi:uncharacterized protein